MRPIKVKKRDGAAVEYDREKIVNAVAKAIDASGKEHRNIPEQVAVRVEEDIEKLGVDEIDVEQIQDMVESTLIKQGHDTTAKKYILYREERNRVRECKSDIMKVMYNLTFGSQEAAAIKRENANIDTDTSMGTMLKYGTEVAKRFNLEHIFSADISDAHRNGDIHIHDLDFAALTETCVTGDTLLTIRDDNTQEIRTVPASIFDKLLSSYMNDEVVYMDKVGLKLSILSSNGEFTKLINCVRHPRSATPITHVETEYSDFTSTPEHKVPVEKEGKDEYLEASKLSVCDRLHANRLLFPCNKYSLSLFESRELRDLFFSSETCLVDEKEAQSRLSRYLGEVDNTYLNIKEGDTAFHIKTMIEEAFKADTKNDSGLFNGDNPIQVYSRRYPEGKLPVNIEMSKHLGAIIGLLTSLMESDYYMYNSDVGEICIQSIPIALAKDIKICGDGVTYGSCVEIKRQYKGHNTNVYIKGILADLLLTSPILMPKYTQKPWTAEVSSWWASASCDFFGGLLWGLRKASSFVYEGETESVLPEGAVRIYSNNKEVFLRNLQKVLSVNGVNLAIKQNFDYYYLDSTNSRVQLTSLSSLPVLNFQTTLDYSIKETQSISAIHHLSNFKGYVYDFETENHHFMANGILVHNCCQIDLEKLFNNGFNTGHGALRTPTSIASYAALACIAIQSNQNDQHGGQSIPAFDYYMAPGVAKSYIKEIIKTSYILNPLGDNEGLKAELKELQKKHRLVLDRTDEIAKIIAKHYPTFNEKTIEHIMDTALSYTTEATHQAMEALLHNLNTMQSRAGSQTPFSSINYGTDTSVEGRMVMGQLLLATEEGLGAGETAIFPIQIFKLKSGVSFNPGDTNYDLFKLACRVSAKRLFPNFSNLDAPFNAKFYVPGNINTEATYMGCRTRVMDNVYDETQKVSISRGNLSFTSINLPRLGILADHDLDKFYELLDVQMDIVHRQLLERFEYQRKRKFINYPFLMGQGVWLGSDNIEVDHTGGDISEILKHGTLTVGFIGLAETLIAMLGRHHGESAEAWDIGYNIIKHMRELTDQWSEAEKMNYSLIATPAEGLSSRFVRIDKKKFGTIPGVTDKDYYTNSFHIPVYYSIRAMKKIDLEAPFHELCNGGHITYVELDGDPTKNLAAFEKVVRYMHDRGIGYGAVNHRVDRDPICGYVGVIDDVCPRCGRRDGEPMSEEMWMKLNRLYHLGSTSTCGACGNEDEEADRVPNEIVGLD